MKASLVMPARNEAATVDATMESIFAQTRLPDEIILADGCSTDDTVARFLAHAGRGVPLRVVRNDTIFAGGGRNAATRAAEHDVIVGMDLANRADPGWFAAMVRPFEEDPALDLLAGLFYPIFDTRFHRVSAAVVYFDKCLLGTLDRAVLPGMVPKDFIPGGMCMAYRKAAWARVGGFSEWARKGQDRLFGHRVRQAGGKVGYTLGAVVHHEMASSFRELFRRHFHYALWAARIELPRPQFRTLALVYTGGPALAAATLAEPRLLPVLALALGAYVHRGAWRKLDAVAAANGLRFDARDRLLGVGVLFVRDGAVLVGNLVGFADRLLRPAWRRKTRAYLEHGA